jgi:hypothetical protein
MMLPAQSSDVPRYENHNMIDYGPLVFRSVGGVVVDSAGVVVPGATIGVFTDVDHKLVTKTTTDARGSFTLQHISSGRYRLVAHFNGFCPANVPVRIVSWPHGGIGRRLVIHAVAGAIDTCSYGAYH